MSSNHSRIARITLAAGGIAVFLAAAYGLYAVDTLIGGLPGLAAGVMLACALTACCGLATRLLADHSQGLTRPAPVRLPVPAADTPEPTRTAA